MEKDAEILLLSSSGGCNENKVEGDIPLLQRVHFSQRSLTSQLCSSAREMHFAHLKHILTINNALMLSIFYCLLSAASLFQ